MNDIDTLFSGLTKYLESLQIKFLDDIEATDSPDDFELDVRAYCILAHAAFEEYFEKIAIIVLNESINNYLQQTPKLNESLLTLTAYSSSRLDLSANNKDSPYISIKKVLEQAKKQLSAEINDMNHGISEDHLRKILLPVSIKITQDEGLLNSLKQLVQERGQFAHKGEIKKILSPEDAKKYVFDCIIISEDVRDKAKQKFVHSMK